jgi:hypothetical protein
MGHASLDAATSASHNTAFGATTLTNNTTGQYNTAVGSGALADNTTANYGVAVGYITLDSNTTGARNCAVGYTAMGLNTTGNYNTAHGSYALRSQTTASFNVGVGYQAGYNLTTGDDSTAVGSYSLLNCTTGIRNVAVGYQASSNVTSSYNTSIGFNANTVTTTGAGNITIGYAANPNGAGTSTSINIGHALQGVGSNYFTFGTSTGSDRVYNRFTTNASWTRVSDERYKKEITDNTDCGLAFINDLRPVTFKWRAKSEIDPTLPDYDPANTEIEEPEKMYGLIAQEVKQALDNHGITDFGGWDQMADSGIQAVSQEMFVHPLIKAVQELSAKVDALEAQLSGG